MRSVNPKRRMTAASKQQIADLRDFLKEVDIAFVVPGEMAAEIAVAVFPLEETYVGTRVAVVWDDASFYPSLTAFVESAQEDVLFLEAEYREEQFYDSPRFRDVEYGLSSWIKWPFPRPTLKPVSGAMTGIFDGRAAKLLDRLGKRRKRSSAGYLYHVTFDRHLDSIAQHGLSSVEASGMTPRGMRAWKSRGVYATERNGVSFWYQRAEESAINRSDHPDQEGWTPVVLRFPASTGVPDIEGSEDAKAKAVSLEHVPPTSIEVWNGFVWVSLRTANLDMSVAYEEDEGYAYFKERNPLSAIK